MSTRGYAGTPPCWPYREAVDTNLTPVLEGMVWARKTSQAAGLGKQPADDEEDVEVASGEGTDAGEEESTELAAEDEGMDSGEDEGPDAAEDEGPDAVEDEGTDAAEDEGTDAGVGEDKGTDTAEDKGVGAAEENVVSGRTSGAGRKRARALEGGPGSTRKKTKIRDMLRMVDAQLASMEQKLKMLIAMVKKQQGVADMDSMEVKQEEFTLPRSMDAIPL